MTDVRVAGSISGPDEDRLIREVMRNLLYRNRVAAAAAGERSESEERAWPSESSQSPGPKGRPARLAPQHPDPRVFHY